MRTIVHKIQPLSLKHAFTLMIEIASFVAAIAVGFIALSWSADRLIEVASTLASRLGMSILTIGMTIVAFGTSAPELLVSSVAAYEGSAGIAIGNALGSNIINIGLVLGICGVVVPLSVSRRVITRELPLLGAIVVFSLMLMLDGYLSQLDGILLAIGLVIYCYYLSRHSGGGDQADDVVILPLPTSRVIIESIVLLAVLMGSSKLLVWGASELARSFGISEVIIGLTVIAFGTSLPELAAALASARKGLFDMVMATVIGSNIFNLLGVLAFPGIISGGLEIESGFMERDGLAMLLLTGLFAINVVSSMTAKNRNCYAESCESSEIAFSSTISRTKSFVLLAAFVVYMGVLAQAVLG